MKRSTKEFIKEARKIKGFSLFDLLHGYIYMRWPYLYISMGKGDHPIAKTLTKISLRACKFLPGKGQARPEDREDRGFAEGYHGKTLTLDTAKALVSVKKEIRIENLEQVIPFEKARDIILRNPDHIAVIDCPCRKGMAHHCEPMDVCMIIGEPFASFVLEHQPGSARMITADEAKQILEDEARRGHVSHAFFKDVVLNRFYAICNCCSCCCGAIKAQRNGTPMVISSGYVSRVNPETCTECGACVKTCPFGAISLNGKLTIDQDRCMGCGVCVNRCLQGALSLALDPHKPAPLEIEKLTAG